MKKSMTKRWRRDLGRKSIDFVTMQLSPNYFKHVKISAVALIKMVTHAVSGGKNEIMGLLQGKVIGDTFIIMDTFGLPVVGVETNVFAGDKEMVYMSQKNELSHEVFSLLSLIGWKARTYLRVVSQPSRIFLFLLWY